MTNANEPIKNLEQAKRYFISMGCSHFHLSRENPKKTDEYRALDIDPSIESEWIKEEFENRIENYHSINPNDLGQYFSSLASIIERKDFYLEKLLELTYKINESIKPDQLKFVLSVIIGNNATKTKGGLIQKSYDLKRKDLANEFYNLAKQILKVSDVNSTSIPFIRGSLLDLIEHYKIQDSKEFISELRNKDYSENFNYYKIFAEKGNKHALKIISECYRQGKGCEIDIEKAKFWEMKLKDLLQRT